MVTESHIRHAMSIFQFFDDLFDRGAFAEADAYIASLPVTEMTDREIIAILAGSLMAKGRLTTRTAFYEQAARCIQERLPTEAEAILRGLE